MIEGVTITTLETFPDQRGRVLHGMAGVSSYHIQEVYFSQIYPGAIKAWHLHKRMELNYIVIQGNIKLVLFDVRRDSPTFCELQELFMGTNSLHQRVHVPSGVWNGFMSVDGQTATVVNLATEVYGPDEIDRMDPKLFREVVYDYDWLEGNIG